MTVPTDCDHAPSDPDVASRSAFTSAPGLVFMYTSDGGTNMSQTTFDDDDLFGEAADEVREDIETSLAEARAALPDPDDVWESEADNVLGVLNGLRSSMDPGDAGEHLRDAKKWYTMAERAHAFADADELASEIEAVEDVISEMRTAREQVSDLAGTVPQLRSALEDARTEGDDAETDDSETDDSETGDADADETTADDGTDAEDDADTEADGGEETAADGGEEATADGGEETAGDGGEEQATLDDEDD